MMWLTYDTSLHFMHTLKDELWVIDRSCLEVHEHTSQFKFRIQAILDDTLDFKIVKKIIEATMNQYRDQNISKKFGINSTEDFAIKLVDEVEIALSSPINKRKVQLHIQETAKYGVTVE